jgi:hypothetical protein
VVRRRKERRQGDTYDTPEPLALAICQKLALAGLRPGYILEPSAGFGPFVRAARAVWPKVVIAAVEPREECLDRLRGSGADLTAPARLEEQRFEPTSSPDLILGNPPYSLAEKHIDLLLGAMRPGAVLAFLLRLPFLGADRNGLLETWPPLAVWPVVPRPSFTGDGETEKIEYAVFVWAKGNESNRGVFSRVEWEK